MSKRPFRGDDQFATWGALTAAFTLRGKMLDRMSKRLAEKEHRIMRLTASVRQLSEKLRGRRAA